MKIWNVNVMRNQWENVDLGTYTSKAQALTAAHEEMGSAAWHVAYQTEDEIHFSNGPATLVVESIYVS